MLFAQFLLIMLLTMATAFLGSYFGASANPGATARDDEATAFGISDVARKVLAVLGLVCVAIGLEADALKLSPNPGIGRHQIWLIIAGTAVLALACLIRTKRPADEEREGAID